MTEHQIPFQSVVEALLDSKDFPRRYLQYFSDIDPASLALLMKAWPQVKPARKRALLKQMEATLEEDTLASYDELARALLTDPESSTRRSAMRLLIDCEDPKLVPAYIKMLETDQDPATRAEAASALGHFVALGELEEISTKIHRQAEEAGEDRERDDGDPGGDARVVDHRCTHLIVMKRAQAFHELSKHHHTSVR